MRISNSGWAAWLAAAMMMCTVAGCDADPTTPAADTTAADGSAGDDTQDAVSNTGASNCGGGLTCQADEACQGRWPGVCSGPAPGPNGCGPDCQSANCGDSTVCTCLSFQCIALPAGCQDCSCAEAILQPYDKNACTCTEDSGGIRFECMGA